MTKARSEVIDSSEHPASEQAAMAFKPQKTRLRTQRLEAYAMPALLVAVLIFFSVYSKTSSAFLTADNFRALVANQTVTAIVAMSALIPLICNEWDLSVGATAGVSSVFVASALSSGTPPVIAILLGIGCGLIIGAVNTLIITRMRVNAVITTLGMATILNGVINQRTGGLAIVSNIPVFLTDFGAENWLGIPKTAYALAIVVALSYYILEHTPTGRYLYALGSNPNGARLVGLRTKLLLGATFLMAGFLASVAGIIQIARSGGADPHVGDSLTLPALAAAFLSAAAVKPGRYNVGGTLVAIFFLATLNNGLNLAGVHPYFSNYVNGAALILGVGLAAYLGRQRSGQTE